MMSCDAAFRREVLGVCHDALVKEGFARFRKEAVDMPIRDGFHCWVGLNTGLYSSHVAINPFVGIHVVPIERLWTSLKRGQYPGRYDRCTATYAVHVGELAPEEMAFEFSRDTDIASEARRLARLYSTVGLTFACSIISYEKLLPLLLGRSDMLGAFPERVAACLFLMNRRDEARAFVEEFRVRNRDYFDGFAAPFLDLMDRADNRA